MNYRAQAKKLLVHYFRELAEQTDWCLVPDNIAEIEGIVDDIIDAVKQELRDEGMFQRDAV